ncbi:MAG: GAF domain-containing protein [bacterium]
MLYFEGFIEDITRQKRAAEEEARQTAERDAFYSLSQRLRAARTTPEIYAIVVEQAKNAVGAAFVSLTLLDGERRQFMRVHSSDTPLEGMESVFPLSGSFAEQVIESGKSRVTDDFLTETLPAWWNKSPFEKFGALAAVPLRTEDAIIGAILAARLREPGAAPFTAAELTQLEAIAEIGGIAIRRVELSDSLERRVQTLTALHESAQRFAGNLDPGELAADVVRTCVESFGLRMASLAYISDDDTAIMAAHYPPDSEGLQTADGGALDHRQIDPETCGALSKAESPFIRQLAGDRDHPAWESAALAAGMRSAAFFPLISRAKPFGFLVLYSDEAERFTTERADFLAAYAHQAAAALQSARLFDDAERRLRELQALSDIDRAVRGSLDLRVILQVLLDKAATELKADAADVLLLDPETQTLSCAASRGFRSDAVRHLRLRLGEGYAGQVALSGRPVSVEYLNGSAETHLGRHVRGEGFVSYHAAPLVAKGVVQGVLAVLNRSALHPTPEWHAFFEALAGQAAIAIDNVSLFEDLREANVGLRMSYDDTIEGWSRALDLRDRETEGHSQRVTQLTLALARAMGVQGADLVHIRRGALLHDIGKMGVPDAILLKPGPLTDAEWKTMRRHPVYARELLEPIAYLRPALDIPYGHHEKWDGTGYPQGLSGNQIPLAARIFAIVDVWDALRSDRPYRPAWSVEKTRAYVQEQAGRHFDPYVVGKFLDLLDAGGILESAGSKSAVPGIDLSTRAAGGAAADEIAGLLVPAVPN